MARHTSHNGGGHCGPEGECSPDRPHRIPRIARPYLQELKGIHYSPLPDHAVSHCIIRCKLRKDVSLQARRAEISRESRTISISSASHCPDTAIWEISKSAAKASIADLPEISRISQKQRSKFLIWDLGIIRDSARQSTDHGELVHNSISCNNWIPTLESGHDNWGV